MIVRRFIKLLLAFRIFKKQYKVTYQGEMSSLNSVWSSKHWTVRNAIVQKFHKHFAILLLEAQVQKMHEMCIVLFYNSRLDCDNTSVAAKILADTIKEKYIPDDRTEFYKGLALIHDPALPKNTYEFNILAK
jgi:hypothetical protein